MKKNVQAGYLLCGIALFVMLTACGDESKVEGEVQQEDIVIQEDSGSEAPVTEAPVSETTESGAPDETTAADASAEPATEQNDEEQSLTEEKEEYEMKDPVLLYMGHASLRIVTG